MTSRLKRSVEKNTENNTADELQKPPQTDRSEAKQLCTSFLIHLHGKNTAVQNNKVVFFVFLLQKPTRTRRLKRQSLYFSRIHCNGGFFSLGVPGPYNISLGLKSVNFVKITSSTNNVTALHISQDCTRKKIRMVIIIVSGNRLARCGVL